MYIWKNMISRRVVLKYSIYFSYVSLCIQQCTFRVLKSVLIPFLIKSELVVQRYFLDYCYCSNSLRSKSRSSNIDDKVMCVQCAFHMIHVNALNPCTIKHFLYIFMGCVHRNQCKSHLCQYWILSKVQFVHLCVCKRNDFD